MFCAALFYRTTVFQAYVFTDRLTLLLLLCIQRILAAGVHAGG
jgi:hypothetical protein